MPEMFSPETEPAEVELNGFDLMRLRLDDEYAQNVSMMQEAGNLNALSAIEETYASVRAEVDETEAKVKVFYFSHGQKFGSELIESMKGAGLTDEELVELVRNSLTFEIESVPTLSDIYDPLFAAIPRDGTPLLTEAQAREETMRGLNYKIAEHLGIV